VDATHVKIGKNIKKIKNYWKMKLQNCFAKKKSLDKPPQDYTMNTTEILEEKIISLKESLRVAELKVRALEIVNKILANSLKSRLKETTDFKNNNQTSYPTLITNTNVDEPLIRKNELDIDSKIKEIKIYNHKFIFKTNKKSLYGQSIKDYALILEGTLTNLGENSADDIRISSQESKIFYINSIEPH
jgi:hypothetical protein